MRSIRSSRVAPARDPHLANDDAPLRGAWAATSMSTTRSGDPLVSVRNLRVSFRLDRQTTFEAVKGITFDIPRNTTVALVGESGSGKSVTSLAMLGLLPPENSIVDPASEIMFGGRDILKLDPNELRAMRGA